MSTMIDIYGMRARHSLPELCRLGTRDNFKHENHIEIAREFSGFYTGNDAIVLVTSERTMSVYTATDFIRTGLERPVNKYA